MTYSRELENFCNFLHNSKLISHKNDPQILNTLLSEQFDLSQDMPNDFDHANILELCSKVSDLHQSVSSSPSYTDKSGLNQTALLELSFVRLVRHNLITYVYPFLLVFGLIGNAISFVAMLKRFRADKKSPNTLSFCLAILCLADFGVLLLACFNEYVEYMWHYSLRSSSMLACKLFYFSCYLCSSFGSYLYAFIAVDRWYAVTRPIQYKQEQMHRNHRQIALIFVFCFVICAPFGFYPALDAESDGRCRFPVDLFKVRSFI